MYSMSKGISTHTLGIKPSSAQRSSCRVSCFPQIADWKQQLKTSKSIRIARNINSIPTVCGSSFLSNSKSRFKPAALSFQGKNPSRIFAANATPEPNENGNEELDPSEIMSLADDDDEDLEEDDEFEYLDDEEEEVYIPPLVGPFLSDQNARILEEQEESDDPWIDEQADDGEDFLATDLAELLHSAGILPISVSGGLKPTGEGVQISGIAHDSRQVREGDLFVCTVGMRVDGHTFAAEAIECGAAALVISQPLEDNVVTAANQRHVAVVEVEDTSHALAHLASAFYGHPSNAMVVVGTTGTNGKTTTSWLVKGLLEELDHSVGLLGTIQYSAGEHLLTPEGQIWQPDAEDPTIDQEAVGASNLWPYAGRYSVPKTTPDSLQMQQLMANMHALECSAVSMEVSSHALALGRTQATDMDVAVFTNLTRDHLDFHNSWEEYREAKLKLFRSLRDDQRQRAVINVDDPEAHHFIEAAAQVPIVTYSLEDPQAVVYATKVELSLFETTIDIITPDAQIQVVSPLLGRPNVYNLLAAAAVGVALGSDPEAIAAGLENTDAVPGRFEMIDEGQPFAVIVDYAHTPDALERLLQSVREIGAKRTILVFGAGGDRDRGKRPQMGRIAHELADVVFVANDNPRTEDLKQIIADIVSGFPIELHNAHPDSQFNWLQDMWHTRHTGEFAEMTKALRYQNEVRRYIFEERFHAIRAAIAMADEGDAVVIAGKGHEDYLDWTVNWTERSTHWFDDRQEARDSLRRVVALQESGVDTREIPWSQVNA